MNRILCLCLVFFLVYMGCSQVPAVSVSNDPEFPERTYSIKQGGREIKWMVYTSGVNKGVIIHRALWTGPLQETVPWMTKILGRILQDYNKQDFHTLMIGRLAYAFGDQNIELTERLITAAKNSYQWDPAKGRPIINSTTGYIPDLCNSTDILIELQQVFSEHGMVLRVSNVEKVLISKVKDIKRPANLLQKYSFLKEEDRLPFDCITWLTISAE